MTTRQPVSLGRPTRDGLGFRAVSAARRPGPRRHARSGRPGLGPNVWLRITRSYRAVNRPLSSQALPAWLGVVAKHQVVKTRSKRRCRSSSAGTT